MEYLRVTEREFEELKRLEIAYKREIGEDAPDEAALIRLREAIQREEILFFACRDGESFLGCCSVSPIFSTYDYRRGGVFDDFYIVPERRHTGIAKALVCYAYENSGVGASLIVGCADCDRAMYAALGFRVPIGNMLAFGA